MTVASATAFEILQLHYTHRLAAAHDARAHGTSVVGRVGPTVPSELILAIGRLPLLVAAEPSVPTPTAEIYMESVIPPETKALFELAVGGAIEHFELLVVSRPYTQLYYYLKEVYRLGRAPDLPPLHMYDLMQSRRDAVRAYNWSQTRAMFGRLERLAGQSIAEDALRTAVSVTNRVRGLQRAFLERRWRSEVSGVEALQVIGAGYFMPPDVYAGVLERYLLEPRTDAVVVGRPRLLVLPSEPLSHLRLHQALEGAGAVVVAEDDGWGSRAPGPTCRLLALPWRASFSNTGWIRLPAVSIRRRRGRRGLRPRCADQK